MLTANELADFRALQVASFPDTCSIQRSSATRNGLDRTLQWIDIATNIPCRITQQGDIAREIVQAGSVVGDSDLVLRLPFDTDITNKDRVIVLNRTFEVTRVLLRSNATVTTVLLGETK